MRTIFTITLLIAPFFMLAQQEIAPPHIWMREGEIFQANSQILGAQMPTPLEVVAKGAVNFNPTLDFSRRKEGWLDIPCDLNAASSLTLVVVYQAEDSLSEQCIYSAKGSEKDIMLSTQQVSCPGKMLDYPGGNATVPVIHTAIQYWGNAQNTLSESYLTLGDLNSPIAGIKPFGGQIAEFLLYDRMLGREERKRLESSLALKYGITLPETDYLDSRGEVVWDYEKNRDYSHRIAGLGKDTVFHLHQKQSTSTLEPDRLTIAAGQIYASNAENQTSLRQGQYLIWGDNDLPFELKNAAGAALVPIHRKWLMSVHGAEAPLSTEVQINLGDIRIPEGYVPALLVDRTGAGLFSPDQVATYEGKAWQEGEARMASFKGVRWDPDRSGEDAFTFALLRKDSDLIHDFSIYPNPSKGAFTASVSLQREAKVYLRIADGAGREIKQYNLPLLSPGEVSRQELFLRRAGLYYLELRDKSGELLSIRPIVIAD